MDIGIFMMPSHPPERSFSDGFEWDLKHLELCDRAGFTEAWIGELVGSPRTVSQKLADMAGDAGGFGTLLVLTFDFSEELEAWATSQQMLMNELLPQFRHRAAA